MAGPARRQSTGKRLRFAVFKRDYFTCQYCGAQPPDAVLVVDHITPVAGGGPSTIDNLLTSCEACNQGKADKPLGERAVRPDADLLYLQTQQEIVELQRYRAAVVVWEAEIAKTVAVIQGLWNNASGPAIDWMPADHLIRQMLGRYSPDVVGEGILDVAPKVANGYVNEDRWVPYLWTVVKNLAERAGEGSESSDG